MPELLLLFLKLRPTFEYQTTCGDVDPSSIGIPDNIGRLQNRPQSTFVLSPVIAELRSEA